MSSRYSRRKVSDIPEDSQTAYREERMRRYPDTYLDDVPSQRVADSYDEYHHQTGETRAAKLHYYDELKKARAEYSKDITTNPTRYRTDHDEQFDYYQKYDGLFPEQHSKLLDPALEASFRQESMTAGRYGFLEKHPYGYKNIATRDFHIGKLSEAERDCVYWEGKAKRHSDFASDITTNSRRDPYGRLRPRFANEDDDWKDQIDEEAETLGDKLFWPEDAPRDYRTTSINQGPSYKPNRTKAYRDDYTFGGSRYGDSGRRHRDFGS